MDDRKGQIEIVEHAPAGDMPEGVSKSTEPLMRSKLDNLTVWKSVGRYKNVAVIAMIAAFSASLDGYREISTLRNVKTDLTDRVW